MKPPSVGSRPCIDSAVEPRSGIEQDQEGRQGSCEIQLQSCRVELSAVVNLAHELAAETDGESVPRRALEHSVHLLGFDGGLLWQAEPRTANLRLAGAVSIPPSLLAVTPAELEVGTGASGQALARREPVLLSIEDWNGSSTLRSALRGAGIQTLLGIPLLAHGHVMGAMVLITTARVRGSAPRSDLAAALGTVVGVALLHAREHAALIQEERLGALGQMAAGVIHELKNPLTVFLGRTRLLRLATEQRPFLTAEEVGRAAAGLDEAAERMKRIVEGLSLYSKPPKADAQTLDVAPLLTAISGMLEFAARKGGVTLRVEAPAPGRLNLLGDRSHLLQVLLNLATNAIEAVNPGGVVTLNARPGEGSAVVLEVTDDGPGIPPEALARIWEPFFTTKAEGTGLGLAIVRSLVKELGGTIQVERREERGTLFRMTFPKAP